MGRVQQPTMSVADSLAAIVAAEFGATRNRLDPKLTNFTGGIMSSCELCRLPTVSFYQTVVVWVDDNLSDDRRMKCLCFVFEERISPGFFRSILQCPAVGESDPLRKVNAP